MSLEKAKYLIAGKRYQEAEALLVTLSATNTEAKIWLNKVRAYLSKEAQSKENEINILVTTADLHIPYEVIGPVVQSISKYRTKDYFPVLYPNLNNNTGTKLTKCEPLELCHNIVLIGLVFFGKVLLVKMTLKLHFLLRSGNYKNGRR